MFKKLPSRPVVFVGGGLTAALAARQLTAQGVDVLVLERGGDWRDSAASTLPNQRDELRWDVRSHLMQDWAAQTYTMRHASSETALPVRRMRAFLPGEGVGGAGNHWNGQTWRWAEYAPTLRTRIVERYGKSAIPADMPLQDWGVTYAELEPYHDLFEKLFGIAGRAGNLQGRIQRGGNPFEAPRQNEYPQAPMEITEAGAVFSAAAEKLGYSPFPMASANSPAVYTNPDGMSLGACQYCGHCEKFFCEANAKASPALLLYPLLEQRRTFELRTHAHVVGLVHDRAAKRVTGVRYVDLASGEMFEQPADVVVLSSFTMTNTQLLLTSGIGKPYDRATGQGVVGKNFCYQTMSNVPVFLKDRWINPFLAAGSSQTVIDDFNEDHFDHSGLGFLGGGYIYANVTSGRPILNRLVPSGTPAWGSAWKRANADWYAHSFAITVHGACYPHADNYLDLDPTYKDAFGQPLLRMTFNFRENETRMSAWCTGKAHEIARATGATIVGSPAPRKPDFDVRQYQTTHVTGGTIMGADPRTSVVSPHLQHWDAHNLFVVGASVYTYNAGYNPTGPLSAMALRLGDDLVRYVAQPQML